jgi:hypothetical protein
VRNRCINCLLYLMLFARVLCTSAVCRKVILNEYIYICVASSLDARTVKNQELESNRVIMIFNNKRKQLKVKRTNYEELRD